MGVLCAKENKNKKGMQTHTHTLLLFDKKSPFLLVRMNYSFSGNYNTDTNFPLFFCTCTRLNYRAQFFFLLQRTNKEREANHGYRHG